MFGHLKSEPASCQYDRAAGRLQLWVLDPAGNLKCSAVSVRRDVAQLQLVLGEDDGPLKVCDGDARIPRREAAVLNRHLSSTSGWAVSPAILTSISASPSVTKSGENAPSMRRSSAPVSARSSSGVLA